MRKSALVCDDDADFVKVVSTTLSTYDLDVDSATDPVNMFTKIYSDNYDYIFLDYKIPSFDGVKILEAIDKKLKARLYFLTGHTIDDIDFKSISHLVSGFIPKLDMSTRIKELFTKDKEGTA